MKRKLLLIIYIYISVCDEKPGNWKCYISEKEVKDQYLILKMHAVSNWRKKHMYICAFSN